MAFENLFVALRDDQFGKLRGEKALQPSDPPQFLHLFGDPHFETAVQFRYLVGPLPQFAEQPRVFHCDDRLRCKVLQQRDFFLCKRSNLLSARHNPTQECAVLPQCHAQESAHTSELGSSEVHWVVNGCLIGDVNETGSVHELPMGVVWIGLVSPAYQLFELRGKAACRQCPQTVAVPYFQGPNGYPAEAVRPLQYRLEHRGEIAGR